MILLHEITRTYFAENLYVFKCNPCGFSMTEPISWTTRPQEASVTRKKHSRNGVRGAKRARAVKISNALPCHIGEDLIEIDPHCGCRCGCKGLNGDA
jgi:hypothetical protein